MEKFRENEKEYKQKKMSKSEMLNENERRGKFKFEDGSDGSYGDSEDEEEKSGNGGLSDEAELHGENYDINIDKVWLQNFCLESLRQILSKYEQELEKLRSKKTKGGIKKNKDKISAIVSK